MLSPLGIYHIGFLQPAEASLHSAIINVHKLAFKPDLFNILNNLVSL